MRLDMRRICGSAVLAGAINGKQALSLLLAETGEDPRAPEYVFLDFERVKTATASFMRESGVALRDIKRKQRSNLYPVFANCNDEIRDELRVLADPPRHDALVTCFVDREGNVSRPSLIGSLDPAQRRTFDLVSRHKITDAGELMRQYGKGEGTSRTTAWNNRLASLALLGIVIERNEGRTKRYQPLFAGI